MITLMLYNTKFKKKMGEVATFKPTATGFEQVFQYTVYEELIKFICY
jgi:hypothetical protein